MSGGIYINTKVSRQLHVSFVYGPIVEVKFIQNLVKSRLSSHPGRGGLGGALVRFPNLLRLVGESDWGGGICHYLGRVVYKVGKIGENFLKAKYYEPV